MILSSSVFRREGAASLQAFAVTDDSDFANWNAQDLENDGDSGFAIGDQGMLIVPRESLGFDLLQLRISSRHRWQIQPP